MWKESYRLGIDVIDEQHIRLFEMTEELVKAVQENASVETYQKILAFLKDYIVYHFSEEEAYQVAISYDKIKEHQEQHRQFTQTVYDYERKLTENGFDVSTMKDLAGTLTAWLIYHVAGVDQTMVSDKARKVSDKTEKPDRYAQLFSDSVIDVMEKMTGMDRNTIRRFPITDGKIHGDLFVEIALIGDLEGKAVFGFSKELALNLIRIMTMMDLNELDELVLSALCELTNISCGSATISLTSRGLACDIKPPVILEDVALDDQTPGIKIDTGSGSLEVAVWIS